MTEVLDRPLLESGTRFLIVGLSCTSWAEKERRAGYRCIEEVE